MSKEAVETKARDNGWVPKEEYTGDETKWRSAEEFNDRGEMIGRFKKSESQVRNLERQLDGTNAALKHLSDVHQRQEERIRKEVKSELLQAKKDAIKEGDGEAVVEIDERLDDIKEEEREAKVAKQEPVTAADDPEIQAFQKEHPEFETNPVLGGALSGAVAQELKENPERSRGEILNAALETIQEQMPHFFEDGTSTSTLKKVSKVSETTGKKRNRPNANSVGAADLNEEQLEYGKKFVKMGTFKNLDEYAKELKEIGEI